MLDALRRLFWLIPLLGLGGAALFFVLSVTIAPPPPGSPLFWNPHPLDSETAALNALSDLERGAPGAAARLAILGGAALPHVLPRLPTLDVATQRTVARALRPVAVRMGQSEFEEEHPTDVALANEDGDRDLAFWLAYHHDHAAEFRPLTVQRLAKRLATHDSKLRRADLLLLDTYALPALLGQLGRVRTQEDVERVRRVARLVSHVTERDYDLPESAGIRDAQVRATELRRMWDRERPIWSEFGPVELAAAHLEQTEFAHFARARLRELAGIDTSEVGERFSARVRSSAPIFSLTFLGAFLLGPALAGVVRILEMRESRFSKRLSPARLGLALALFSFLPAFALHPPENPLLLGVGLTLSGTLLSAYVLERDLRGRVEWRIGYVLARRPGLARLRAVLEWLGPTVPTFVPLIAAESLSLVALVEANSGIPGIGSETMRAISERDAAFLLIVTLFLGAAFGVLQTIADQLFRLSRVRVQLREGLG